MGTSIRQWFELDGRAVRDNRQLFKEFSDDYLYLFGKKVNKNCGVCWLDYWYNMIKKQETMGFVQKKETVSNTEYKLKAKYNGIRFFGKMITQHGLTDTIAKKLIKDHPAGENLFDFIPKPKKTTKKATKKQ